MASVELPFGRTGATVEELRRNIDVKTASDELSSADVSDPDDAINSFVESIPLLLAWLEDHGRDYPWRQTTDPWRVYATEILLQRTRSDAVAEVYTEFFDSFPSPDAILDSTEDGLRDVIYPLGFVNHRTRALQEAAELCAQEHNGRVPADLEALQRPWRVGSYTARACLLFAFNRPLALVDTNTSRIIGRVLDYPLPEQPHKSTRVYRLLDALTPEDPSLARAFNFALLDLGALICTSESPSCVECPLVDACEYAHTAHD